MADPQLGLDNVRPAAQPGGQARVTVTVFNPGTVVEGYRLQVLGVAAPWAEVVPPEVSVYPQQSVTASVVFSPPSGAQAPGGVQPFAVMARSTLDPNVSAVTEGDLEIGQVYGLQAKLIPVTSAGRWRGRHVVQLANWGNSPATVRLVAADPDDALGFYLSPQVVSLPLQGKATVRMSVRTKHPFLRGSPVRLPFQVVGERLDAEAGPPPGPGMAYGDPARPVVDGALTQKPILSAGFVTLVTLALVAVIGFGAYLLLRPASPAESLASRGSPPKPTLEVVSTTSESISLRWSPIELVERYTVLRFDGESGGFLRQDAVDGGITTFTDTPLKAGTKVCYQLSATRGGLTGPLSDQVCAATQGIDPTPSPTPTPSETPTPSASPTPSATPTVTPGDRATDPIMNQAYIAVLTIYPRTLAGKKAADQQVVDLSAFDLQPVVLDTAVYPNLLLLDTNQPPVQPAFLVYVGPYETFEDSDAACTDIQNSTGITGCTSAQPDP